MKLVAAVFIAVVTTSSNAQVDLDSGTRFLPACKAFLNDKPPSDSLFDVGQCLGIAKTLRAVGPGLSHPYRSCIPKDFVNFEIVSKIVEFLEKNPERLGGSI